MTDLISTKHDGKKGIIIGNHPHVDAVAICLGACKASLLGKYGMIFKRIDTDEEFFVFDGKNVKWINE